MVMGITTEGWCLVSGDNTPTVVHSRLPVYYIIREEPLPSEIDTRIMFK